MDKLSSRRIRPEYLVTPELARALTELSQDIHRQIGVLIDRKGHVRETIVGDTASVFLPDLSAYRQGRSRFCGLRLIHTHLNDSGLDDDDLTDLALLRLDAVAAIAVQDDGLPGKMHVGHLQPANADHQAFILEPPRVVHEEPDDFLEKIDALEGEFAQQRSTRRADGTVPERAIVVHVSQGNRTEIDDSVAELCELCGSAGIEVVDTEVQRRRIDPKSIVGRGKLRELVIRAMQTGAEALVFDLNITPAQVRTLAGITDLKILDRTQVILDIFAQRAQTREGQVQVELAQLRYTLPLLSTKHTALSRLTGGIGGRGPGETKLEIDRRRAQDRIAQLRREIDKLGKRRRLRRQRRTDQEVPTISVVGYTNAGKSTLLNNLTRSDVRAENELFATLNPVSRRLRFPEEREVIITDTVGFIRKLPPELMEAFKTTFEEIEPSSLLLHVLDASSSEIDQHYAEVRRLLGELELGHKKSIVVLNKIDKCDPEDVRGLVQRYDAVPVSALDSSTFGPLLERIEEHLWEPARVSGDAYSEDDGSDDDDAVRDAV